MREWIRKEMYPKYVSLLRQFGQNDSIEGREEDARDPSEQPATFSRVGSPLMEDVMQISRKLPSHDPVADFFRRFNKKGFPKTNGKTENEDAGISTKERLVATLILKPVLAIWNKASRDTKERWRGRAKTAFGANYVNRIDQLARRTDPGQAAGK
jgi:hypothetical protein